MESTPGWLPVDLEVTGTARIIAAIDSRGRGSSVHRPIAEPAPFGSPLADHPRQ